MSTSPEQFPDSEGLTFTRERLIDQLGHLVPQVHVTLVSVLQGIALAFLLTALRGPSSGSITAIWTAMLVHHLYLPHIVSFMLVIIAWNEYAYAMLFLYWPLTAFSTALQFLFAAFEIMAFTNVDTVPIWALWIGGVALLGALIHLHDVKITSESLYPYGSIARDIVGVNDWLTWILGFLMIALGLLRIYGIGPATFAVMVGSVHVVLLDLIIPTIVLVLAVAIMREDDTFYVRNINRIFEKSGSAYRLTKNGRIDLKGYRSE